MSIFGRGMTTQERFHFVMWLVSFAVYGAFLWFCLEYGLYSTATSPICAIAATVFLVLVVANAVSFVSFADTGSRVRIIFTYAVPAIVVTLAFVNDQQSIRTGIYFLAVAFLCLASYFFVDSAFLQRRHRSRRTRYMPEDEDGSVDALYVRRTDTTT